MNVSRRTFIVLWLLCVLGGVTLLPYTLYLGMLPVSVSLLHLMLIAIIQTSLFYGVICFLSSKLYRRVDFEVFQEENFIRRILFPGVLFGALLGLLLLLLNKMLFTTSALVDLHAPFWAGLLASIAGGVNEEVFLRLFLFTLFYYVFRKFVANKKFLFWSTNITVALLFGLFHLPAASNLILLTTSEIARILLLNGISGLLFGWIFFRKGIYAAMIAHFTTDVVIHGIQI